MKPILIFFFCITTFLFCDKELKTIKLSNFTNTITILNYTGIEIDLNINYPKHLIIYTPDTNCYYFFDDNNKEIIISNNIVLKPWNTKGTRFQEGKKITELIFTKRGIYTLYFADNTETEKENTFYLEKKLNYEKHP